MNLRVLLVAYLPTPVFLADVLYTRFVESGAYPGSLWYTVSGDAGLLKWGAVAISCILLAKSPQLPLPLKERVCLALGGLLAALLLYLIFIPLVDIGSIRGIEPMLRTALESAGLFAAVVLIAGGIQLRGSYGLFARVE